MPESSGLSRMEPTRPVSSTRNSAGAAKHGVQPADNAQAGNRKSERMARRELLYAVVREAMARAGMLSSSYKFKVLSLDARGRQFLVMMDLAREHGDETSRLAEIEALIAQSAKARYDIVVTAVYWRLNEHVAVGAPLHKPAHAVPTRASSPMPLEPHAAPVIPQPVPLIEDMLPLPSNPHASQQPAANRFEPLADDEVAAFQKALAAGVAARPLPVRPVPVPAAHPAHTVHPAHPAHPAHAAPAASARTPADGAARHGPQSYTLLTGYEDTEMPDDQPALSGTQYGALN